jgi:hypothetical protein
MALSLYGMYGYTRDTWRGETVPNRVTWGLWGFLGILSFGVELQQHVGIAAYMTLILGVIPIIVISASFHNKKSVWQIGKFDIVCGAASLIGVGFWVFINQPTVALVSFCIADHIAALPTVRKSWIAPETESPQAFLMGFVNCLITILTLDEITTAGALFPGVIVYTDILIWALLITNMGPRVRSRLAKQAA